MLFEKASIEVLTNFNRFLPFYSWVLRCVCVFEITLIWSAFGKYFLAVFSCILIILILLFTEHLCYFNEIKTISSLMTLVFDLKVIDLRSYLWPSKYLYILSYRNLKFYISHLGLWSFLGLFLCERCGVSFKIWE